MKPTEQEMREMEREDLDYWIPLSKRQKVSLRKYHENLDKLERQKQKPVKQKGPETPGACSPLKNKIYHHKGQRPERVSASKRPSGRQKGSTLPNSLLKLLNELRNDLRSEVIGRKFRTKTGPRSPGIKYAPLSYLIPLTLKRSAMSKNGERIDPKKAPYVRRTREPKKRAPEINLRPPDTLVNVIGNR